MYRLRELERQDLAQINGWRNNPALIEMLGAPYRFINLEVDERWFDNYMSNRGNAVRCSIVDEYDSLLGLVSLTSIDYMNQCAQFHIMIGETENQNKGAGTFAVCAMLRHAFDNMNLRRVELTVLEDNLRAQHLYEKVGFRREGMKRSARYKNGSFVNMYMYAVLKEEFVDVLALENVCVGGGTRLPD